MSHQDEIVCYVIKGYNNNNIQLITKDDHKFVLNDVKDNFVSSPAFKLHKWAASLKSSQAFAYNVFSESNNYPLLQFEFPMKVFNRDAQIDIMLEDIASQTIELYEVKAFEIINLGVNKIVFKEQYFNKAAYMRPDIAEHFIKFLHTVIEEFKDQKIYGGGIKQLCSHLLGILNKMDESYYIKKKFKLYSFCLDEPFSYKFQQNIDNYKKTLSKFKNLVDEFLNNINVNARVEYCGFLSAREYLNQNKNSLGIKNYNYVMKRYFFSNQPL